MKHNWLPMVMWYLAAGIIFAGGEPHVPQSGDGVKPFSQSGEFVLPADLAKKYGDYRKNWHRLTGYEYSGLHWKQYVVIYVNKKPDVFAYNYKEFIKHFLSDDEDDEDEDEEDESDPEFKMYPVGTIFLKEHYVSKNGRPTEGATVSIMEKMAFGYDAEHGDWKYIWVDGNNGKVLMQGKTGTAGLQKSCIECHQSIPDRDYIFSTYIRSDILKEISDQ